MISVAVVIRLLDIFSASGSSAPSTSDDSIDIHAGQALHTEAKACGGPSEIQPSVQVSDGDHSLAETATKATLVPGSPDFLMSYSTLPGSSAYGHPQTGGLYIRALRTNLHEKNSLEVVLKKVSDDVSRDVAEYGRTQGRMYRPQLPFYLTTGMTKLIFL